MRVGQLDPSQVEVIDVRVVHKEVKIARVNDAAPFGEYCGSKSMSLSSSRRAPEPSGHTEKTPPLAKFPSSLSPPKCP